MNKLALIEVLKFRPETGEGNRYARDIADIIYQDVVDKGVTVDRTFVGGKRIFVAFHLSRSEVVSESFDTIGMSYKSYKDKIERVARDIVKFQPVYMVKDDKHFARIPKNTYEKRRLIDALDAIGLEYFGETYDNGDEHFVRTKGDNFVMLTNELADITDLIGG